MTHSIVAKFLLAIPGRKRVWEKQTGFLVAMSSAEKSEILIL
jgi:hypothetical protein